MDRGAATFTIVVSTFAMKSPVRRTISRPLVRTLAAP
jgi:hypothetical protein